MWEENLPECARSASDRPRARAGCWRIRDEVEKLEESESGRKVMDGGVLIDFDEFEADVVGADGSFILLKA
uniref:Uncharacterized protein n=1 Tax=Oryza meridionalis TaxID=40149 RepID=A0A0E0CE74_9ORYZ